MGTGDCTAITCKFVGRSRSNIVPTLDALMLVASGTLMCPSFGTPHQHSLRAVQCATAWTRLFPTPAQGNTAVQRIRRPALKLVTPIVTSQILHFSLRQWHQSIYTTPAHPNSNDSRADSELYYRVSTSAETVGSLHLKHFVRLPTWASVLSGQDIIFVLYLTNAQDPPRRSLLFPVHGFR